MKIKQLFLLILGIVLTLAVHHEEPIKMAYVSQLSAWWPPEAIANSLGVPGSGPYHGYNHLALSYWGCGQKVYAARVWAYPTLYFKENSEYGATKDEIQISLKNALS